jgi:predicted ATPase/DNA-binding CsgD family transcriptional regulator
MGQLFTGSSFRSSFLRVGAPNSAQAVRGPLAYDRHQRRKRTPRSRHAAAAVVDDSVTSVEGLPGQLSRFIGRERELAELVDLVGQTRLVTLTGPGGSGKTRLALELAARLPEGLAESVVFVDLAPVLDPDLIVPTIAGTLSTSGRPSLESLVKTIRARRLVLLLDNLEQLAGAGEIAAGLLADCPSLRILATSRAPLHVRGEREYPVEPLALPAANQIGSVDVLSRIEAIALFVDRAREISPHFELTAENAPAIAEICRRLDGLPLAIELAAGQTKLLSPDALLRRLERSLPMPADGPRDAPARQRALRDSIAWSHELLREGDRTVFARLSVFVGGFGLPDAEAIVPDPNDPVRLDVLASLGRLVDINLVRVVPDAGVEPRFGFLETIREFAIAQLTEAATEPLRERHAKHFADLADASIREIGRPQRATWLRRVWPGSGADLPNVRAAVDRSRERHDLQTMVRLVIATPALADHIEQGWEALGAAEALAETADPAIRAYLLRSLAASAMLYGADRERSRAMFSECLLIYEGLGLQRGMAVTLRDLAAVDFDLGDRARARAEIERALQLAKRVEDPLEATRLLIQIASVHIPLHPLPEGLRLAREVIDRATAIDLPPIIAFGRELLGGVLLALGDLDGAIETLSESGRIWRDLGEDSHPGNAAVALLGIARLRAGQLEESRSLLATAAGNDIHSGVVWKGLTTLEGQADWLGAAGRSEPATVCWATVDQIRSTTRDRTLCNDFGLFAASRKRDRAALSAGDYRKARARGQGMTLGEALEYATRALGETVLPTPAPASQQRRGRHDLTPREREVLALLGDGQSDGQIAEALYISKKTAAVHVANIKGKLGAGSRVEIVTKALSLGLANIPRP